MLLWEHPAFCPQHQDAEDAGYDTTDKTSHQLVFWDWYFGPSAIAHEPTLASLLTSLCSSVHVAHIWLALPLPLR